MNRSEKYINLNYVFSCIPRIKNLLKQEEYIDIILSADKEKLKKTYGLNNLLIDKLASVKKDNPAKKELEFCTKLGIKITTPGEKDYPLHLNNIYDPPLCLYYKGKMPADDDILISVVGSRAATPPGRINAENMGFKLASYGITVVSGMARGIDTCAHTGALKAGGKTLAVLGCGLNIVYPPENKKLMKQISETGAVISEFPPEAPPNAWNFPIRNRIISGISMATIVVEASQKSGSLITAGCALEQGKEVFAMPGNALSQVAKGVNRLIKDGARLIENAEDILLELNIKIR
ncbi:MAG: DNA-processing protein DprA [Armatimonadota bacterium]